MNTRLTGQKFWRIHQRHLSKEFKYEVSLFLLGCFNRKGRHFLPFLLDLPPCGCIIVRRTSTVESLRMGLSCCLQHMTSWLQRQDFCRQHCRLPIHEYEFVQTISNGAQIWKIVVLFEPEQGLWQVAGSSRIYSEWGNLPLYSLTQKWANFFYKCKTSYCINRGCTFGSWKD